MSSSLLAQYSDSLTEFCELVKLLSESSHDPASTVELCDMHAETVRIRPQDISTDTIDLLFDTLLQVVTNLERRRQREQQQRRWIFQFKKRLRPKPARSRKSGPKRIVQENKRKTRAPRKVVVLQLSECDSLPAADLLLLEPGTALQELEC